MSKKAANAKKTKTPWPTKEAMEQVYSMNLWGNNDTAFYSGEGSHHPEIVAPYIEAVTQFLTSFETPISVTDLGCGDFNIGNQLAKHTKNYTAVDIVENLIEHNKTNFKQGNVTFHCLDIAKDTLPKADCAVLRQVLQHLSNLEIQQILSKLRKFQYIIITEHIPKGIFTANIDIISGQGTRLKKQSGLDLLAPPFHFSIQSKKELVTVDLGEEKGLIVTTLYQTS